MDLSFLFKFNVIRSIFLSVVLLGQLGLNAEECDECFIANNDTYSWRDNYQSCQDPCLPCCQPRGFGSFYIGLSIDDIARYSHNHNETLRFNPADPSFPGPVSISRGDGYGELSEIFGTITLGYLTRNFNCFNLAVEAFISGAPKFQNDAGTVEQVFITAGLASLVTTYGDFYMNTNYGIVVMPGYQIQRNLGLFARLGYVATRAQFHTYSNGRGTVNSIGFSSALDTFDFRKTETLHSFQAGFGMSYRTSEKVYWRAGYYWNKYNKFRFNFLVSDPDSGQFVTNPGERDFSAEGIYVATEYYFCPPEPYCPDAGICRCKQEAYVGVLAVRNISEITACTHTANTIEANPLLGRAELYSPGAGTQNGWGAEVVAGYGCTFTGGYYVGIEGFYNNVWKELFATSYSEIPPNVASSSAGRIIRGSSYINIDNNFGLSVLPGYKPNECLLLYLKLGLTKARLHQHGKSVANPPAIPRDEFLNNFTRSKDLWGYLYGFGADIGITECLFLRGEFIKTNFGRIRFERKACCSGAGFFVRRDFYVVPSNRQFKLGLIYKFPVCNR
jgi:opacity protein-like surface antigen